MQDDPFDQAPHNLQRLIFFPYFAFQALGEITGAKPLFALYLKQRRNVTIGQAPPGRPT